jgi:regulatory protein
MEDDPLREKARKKAYRLLALRAHSEKELGDKLRGGGFGEAIIVGVIEKCRQLGYLNDASYARQRARELAVNRLQGDRRIAADLGERGIDGEVVREALADARREISEEAAVERFLDRKLRGGQAAAMDERLKARLMRGLMGRGFPAGLIYGKLKRMQEDGFHEDDGE